VYVPPLPVADNMLLLLIILSLQSSRICDVYIGGCPHEHGMIGSRRDSSAAVVHSVSNSAKITLNGVHRLIQGVHVAKRILTTISITDLVLLFVDFWLNLRHLQHY